MVYPFHVPTNLGLAYPTPQDVQTPGGSRAVTELKRRENDRYEQQRISIFLSKLKLTPDNKLTKREQIAKRLFVQLVPCMVPFKSTISVDVLEYRGLPSSGVGFIDKVMHEDSVSKHLSVAGMVEVLSEGYWVIIESQQDIDYAYLVAQEFLAEFTILPDQQVSLNAMSQKTPPVKDLKEIEIFAKTLFPHTSEQRGIQSALPEPVLDLVQAMGSQMVFDPMRKKIESHMKRDRWDFTAQLTELAISQMRA